MRIFPITVTYADGQVIGQFQRRGNSLFYDLKKSTIHHETFPCALIYTSPSDPKDIRTFQLREGQCKRLGDIREFLPSKTMQGILEALKHFTLVIKRTNE